MSNAAIKVFRSIFKLAFAYPKSFFKQLNGENWRILKKAILNESPSQIIKNARMLLQNTNKDSTNQARKRANKFVNSINFPANPNLEIVLFASHEASRSGAPLIILEVAKYFKEKYNVLPIQLICDDGELLNEFAKVGPTYLIQFYFNAAMLKEEMTFLMAALNKKANIKKAYVNSEGAGKLLPFLKKAGIKKVISLIHEMAHYYDKNAWPHINKNADIIVFPAELVKKRAIANTTFDEKKLKVIGQGLLKGEILNADKDTNRKWLRNELKIERDAIVIIGCGITILRKGIDIFILSAISFLNAYKGKQKVYFVWLGEENKNDYLVWNKSDIIESGWANNIRLIGNRKDTVPYFTGSDIFFLSSRGDPFPCVIHEAMAAKLPIVAFDGATGFAEIINEDIGKTVAYGDIQKAVMALSEVVDKFGQSSYYKNKIRLDEILNNSRYCEALYNL